MKLFNTYEEAFAYWAPIYRTRHEHTSPTSCILVRADIEATLTLWRDEHARTPCTGKLMAELDAIRDRERAIRKGRK